MKNSSPSTSPESKAASKVSWADPSVPSRGLMPASLLARKSVRKFTFQFSVVVLLVIGLAAVGWGMMAASNLSVTSDRDNIVAQNNNTLKQLTSLKVIEQKVQSFDTQRHAVAVALQNDVTYSQVLAAVETSAPAGVLISSMSTQFGGLCPGPNPFAAKPAVGCVTIQGTAPSAEAVNVYVQNLLNLSVNSAKPALLVDPYNGSSADGTAGPAGHSVSFLMTVNYSAQALSLRYAKFLPGIASPATAKSTTKTGG